MRSIAVLLVLLAAEAAYGGPNLGNNSSDAVVFAEEYGAVPDGATDNSVALQNIISTFAPHGATVQFSQGAYVFTDTLFIENDGLIFRGVAGNTHTPDSLMDGTTLLFDAINATTEPPGIIIRRCEGVGFENMNLVATDGFAGHFITYEDAQYCWMQNVRINFSALENATGVLAAVRYRSLTGDGTFRDGCTGNWMIGCHILANGATGAAARAGIGLLFSGEGASNSFVTGNHFVACKVSNFENAGCAVRMVGTATSPAANNRFTNCWIGVPADGVLAGIDMQNADRNHFYSVTIDGDGTDTVLQANASCEGNIFLGSIDGAYSDLGSDPTTKFFVIDMAPTGGQPMAQPFIQLYRRQGNPVAAPADGTLWIGSRDAGTGDTLFVHLDGVRHRIAVISAP